MCLAEISPVFFTIVKEPLIAESNNTLVLSTRDYFALWLIVGASKASVNKVLFDDGLSFLDLKSVAKTHKHNSLIETLCVNLVLRLSKLFLIFLGLNLEILYKLNS